MVASIGGLTSAAQGVSYYERDGYYTKDDAEHRQASAWAGRGAAEAGLEGPVDTDAFRAVLEGNVPDGSGRQLGRMGKDGEIAHRPGRDLTLSAPKSVSLAALVGGDARIVDAHDRAVARTLAWFEKNVAERRMKDPETGRMVRTGDQKSVIATFRHDTSRNLDPALHTHSVIANMVKGPDGKGGGKWRSMSNEKLYASKMVLGALYRNELAAGLARLGYGIEKTHADGRFEIAGVSRDVVEALSTRRAEILAGMAERNLESPADNPRLAERAIADERETIALMRAGQARGAVPMRGRAVDKALRNGPLTKGQKDAVRLILSAEDRVVGVQGHAGSGKTTMLKRARTLMEKKGYEVRGLAPSASAARTLEGEAGIGSETLQRFLLRYNGVAEGRMTKKGEKDMRAAFAKTALVVDEGSLASTVQAHDLLRIADALRIPRVVLVGDEKQLDAVDAGKPFAQLQREGMKTVTMDEIMHQRDPELKAAVEASLAGDVRKAFEKLGSNIAEVKPDNLAGAAAARWLALSPEERANAGLMAPSHALREGINEIVRERLVRDGVVHGPAMESERLVSKGYTNAEKSLAANYAPGDVVAFHRPYKRLGVEKGDELRVAGVDREARAVMLQGRDGQPVPWKPGQIGARSGGIEVYKREAMELRAGDRIRWTRNDMGLGLVNSQTAEVAAVRDGSVTFRLEGGRMLDLHAGDAQLRHVDRAWASTVHAFQGRTVDTVIAAMEANHPNLTTQKTLYVEISRARDNAELVTDDNAALRAQLEAATGERIAALEAVEPEKAKGREGAPEIGRDMDRSAGREGGISPSQERERTPAPKNLDRGMSL